MELTFNKVGKQYEAEFELTADANLHIEFESATPVKLYQRTTGGGWDLVNDVKNAVGKATDVDLQALIYPKFIKVVCPSNPSYCAVTSDGEVTEIKSQVKTVEVTSNGTTSVEPDAGFSYLSKVDVKTNVLMSGGSGEEKAGFVYLTKEALFTGLDYPIPETLSQDKFKAMMDAVCATFAVVATRHDGDNCNPIQGFAENVEESRITCDNWDAVAINFDQLMLKKDEGAYSYVPMWQGVASTIEEAKTIIQQAFPNQLTEDEFFGRA